MAVISVYSPNPNPNSLESPWQQVNWTSLDLPTVRFRIGLPGGNAEYRPEEISADNRTKRERVLAMIAQTPSPLRVSLLNAIQQTRSQGGIEHSAYIFQGGEFSPLQAGTAAHAPVGQRPQGQVIGFMHTHPVSSQNLAPPSANDFGIPFGDLAIQLVAEMGGRLWLLFPGGYSNLLGRFAENQRFTPLDSSPSAHFVYLVVSSDQLRLEAYQEESQRQRDRAAEFERRMREARQSRHPG